MRFHERRVPARRLAFWAALAPILAGLSLPCSATAQEEDDASPHSTASLISEMATVQPGTPFTVAVHFELDPGWHNYWENAGDSGLPTTIEWNLPSGFEAGKIQWPVPSRIVAYPLVDYGYSNRVTLLVDISPAADLSGMESVTLEATVDWLICESICLPAYAELAMEIPVSSDPPAADPRWLNLFEVARSNLPKVDEGWAVEAETTETGYRLSVGRPDGALAPPDSVYFYSSGSSILDHASPQEGSTSSDGSLFLSLEKSPYALEPEPALRGILVAEDGGSWDEEGSVVGLQVEVPVSGGTEGWEQGSAAVDETGASLSVQVGQNFTFPLALAFAFFGGILLNLMPCVFPILSLKILGVASQGGENRVRIRNQGMVFGLGVILAFLALGGLLIILRIGGAQLGWGFQLQSPIFVAFMASLFFAIGLNLMGVFEVGAGLTRVGGTVKDTGGYGESMVSGVLATVIATPCTAPFMGAALGYALTRSIPETLLIFGVLGIGMALPYLVLSLAPGLLERIPRPGPWMETLKEVLAFPMFATVIWLLWVFGQQTGIGGASYLLTALLLVSAAGWMVGKWQRTDQRSGIAARIVSLGILALAIFFAVRGSGQEAPLAAVEEGWIPFSQAEVEETVAQGRPAFVDFTAAWCLTCQVNERVVLGTETIQNAFRERDVALFKADWTLQDPEITAALEALGRSGVPVYVLYRGNQRSPAHILPAILTEQIVLDALSTFLTP